ncbi:class I SAM-dependent methyltransferase [Candidatus Woesebacteria bacterium]|nr:MAG: class I SAM-dependent methyltransferase [Candidatus Woesebacteria bacterium]
MMNIYEHKLWGTNERKINLTSGSYLSLKYLFPNLTNKKSKLLDIGCAAGAYTASIKKYFPKVDTTGIDISTNCIKYAKNNFPNNHFVIGNIEKMPFAKNSFKYVTANHILEHTKNPKDVICEVKRVLTTSGIFYSVTPTEGSILTIIGWLRKFPFFDNNRINYLGHVQKFTKESLIQLLENNGFEIIETKWSCHFSYQIIDAFYYPFLYLINKNTHFMGETHFGKSESRLTRKLFWATKACLNILSNFESILLSRVPGFAIHITAVKQ